MKTENKWIREVGGRGDKIKKCPTEEKSYIGRKSKERHSEVVRRANVACVLEPLQQLWPWRTGVRKTKWNLLLRLSSWNPAVNHFSKWRKFQSIPWLFVEKNLPHFTQKTSWLKHCNPETILVYQQKLLTRNKKTFYTSSAWTWNNVHDDLLL